MATLYTDAAREERYARLRTKKKGLEKCLDVCMLFTLFVMGGSVIINAIGGLLSFLSLDFGTALAFLIQAAVTAAVIWAIYQKDVRYSAIVLAVTCVIGGIELYLMDFGLNANLFAPFVMIAVLLIDIQWQKLSQEEGFPLFDISYKERAERERQIEKISKNRAVAEGVRIASTAQTSDMGDLLDADFDKPVMAQGLSGYHDRMRTAKPGTERKAAYQPGMMDMLEDLGAPSSAAVPVSADEIPEVPTQLPGQQTANPYDPTGKEGDPYGK